MKSAPSFRRFALAYGPAFAILYVIALKLDLALFTIYPTIGVVLLGTQHSRDTVAPSMGRFLPAMHWYGWTATAALGALIFALVAAQLPERWTRRLFRLGQKVKSAAPFAPDSATGHINFEAANSKNLVLICSASDRSGRA